MNDKNDAQKFSSRLIGILGENRWREARWVLLLIGISLVIFLMKPDFLFKRPVGKDMPQSLHSN